MKPEIDYSSISELPNKTLRFQILDEKKEVAGYAIASAIDSFTILGTSLNYFPESADLKALQNDLERFCEVYYHMDSDKTTES